MRTVASVLNVGWYTFCGLVLGVLAGGLIAVLMDGIVSQGSPIAIACIGGAVSGLTVLGFLEGMRAFKARPRGLGQRAVTRWRDGKPYTDYEKY